jgi:hypothetical protein
LRPWPPPKAKLTVEEARSALVLQLSLLSAEKRNLMREHRASVYDG